MSSGLPTFVLGDGVSGRAAMALLASLERPATLFAQGVCELPEVFEAREAVVSPGFAMDHPWLERLRSAGVQLVSELEFGARHLRSRVVAITGSLGKTTMVRTAVEVLQSAGFSAEAAGNIGRPVSDLALQADHPEWAVLEVSSFQLETMSPAFAPDAAVILNVFPNHLDRHGDFDAYRLAKVRLLRGLSPSAPRVAHASAGVPEGLPVLSAIEGDGHITIVGPEGLSLPLQGTMFDNSVLGENAALLIDVLLNLEIPQDAILQGLKAMEPLAHRVQFLGQANGVRFVDDSKSTCVAATIGALRQLSGPVRLLLGGRAKQNDFAELLPILCERSVHVYTFGEAAPMIEAALSEIEGLVSGGTFEESVARALGSATAGDTILLSPACTSFDAFGSYAERGRIFGTLIREFHPNLS